MKSVLYALASWSGARSGLGFRDNYIEKHLEHLKLVKHNLKQISIGNPDNQAMSESYSSFMRKLKSCGVAPIVVHNMPNIGRSYGQWSRIFEQYKTSFDYYIFIEDDYVPVMDNFDSVLIDIYEQQRKEKNCGFLSGLILDERGRYGSKPVVAHAGVSNGIASSDVLEKVWEKFGMLPHDLKEYRLGQIEFSQGFIKAGFSLGEYVSQKHRCLYYNHCNKVPNYGPNPDGLDVFNPIQIAGKESEFELISLKEDSTIAEAKFTRKTPPRKKTPRKNPPNRRR